MKYTLLQVIPEVNPEFCTKEVECENREQLIEALLEYTDGLDAVRFIHRYTEGEGEEKSECRQDVLFHVVEVNGEREIVRWFKSGIYRRGGVKRRPDATLEDIAKTIGWKRDPKELLEEGWDGEGEKWEQLAKPQRAVDVK